MDRRQKIITTVLWSVLVIAMLGVVGTGLWAKFRPDPLPVLYAGPAFTLTDQDARTFGSEDLRGKTWVAAFIFTHCPGVCPQMTMKMAALQQAVPDRDVHLVSFTVDPERDTPAVLKDYAGRFEADLSRWHFLTGDGPKVFEVAAGLKLTAAPAGKFGPDIVHAEKLLLIDGEGRVRGAYDSKDEQEMKQLAADAAALADRQAGRLF